MLAYAWRMMGWFLAVTAVALGFLLVPLKVAAERKTLDRTMAEIADAHRQIRALETEFDTRANLAQVERWNSDHLQLIAPVASQYVDSEAALARLDAQDAGAATTQVASFVPAAPDTQIATAPAAAPAAIGVAAVPTAIGVAAAPATVAAATTAAPVLATAPRPAPVERVASARPPRGPERTQAIAMVDHHLLSERTMADLAATARSEGSHDR